MERCNDVRRSFVLGDGPACRRRPVTPALPITRDREFAPPRTAAPRKQLSWTSVVWLRLGLLALPSQYAEQRL